MRKGPLNTPLCRNTPPYEDNVMWENVAKSGGKLLLRPLGMFLGHVLLCLVSYSIAEEQGGTVGAYLGVLAPLEVKNVLRHIFSVKICMLKFEHF